MKKIILILFCMVSVSAMAQNGWIRPNNSVGTIQNGGSFDSSMKPPTGSGNPVLYSKFLRKADFFFDSTNNRLWIYNPKLAAWDTIHIGVVGGGGGGSGTVTSVGLSMPSAFNVGGTNPITGTGTFNVTANGTASQVILGNGALGSFTDSTTASNGLTESSNNIKLGGTLTENTTVTTDGYDLTFDGGSSTNNTYIKSDDEVYLYIKGGTSGTNTAAIVFNDGKSSIEQVATNELVIKTNNGYLRIDPLAGDLRIDSIQQTTVKTNKKIVLRDPSTDKVEEIPIDSIAPEVTFSNGSGTGDTLLTNPSANNLLIKRLEFTGAGVGSVTPTADKLTIDIPGGGGSQTLQQTVALGAVKTLTTKDSSASTDYTAHYYQPSNYNTSYSPYGVGGRFSSGWGVFAGVNPTSGRPNVVMNFLGYNVANGGGRVNTSEAAFRFAAESYYEQSGKNLFEFHLPEVTTKTGTIYRPFSIHADRDTTAGSYLQSLIPRIEFYSGNANTGPYFSALGVKSTGAWEVRNESPNGVSGLAMSGTGADNITYVDGIGTTPNLFYRGWATVDVKASTLKVNQINESGTSVGIGTATPGKTLDVYRAGDNAEIIRATQSSGGSRSAGLGIDGAGSNYGAAIWDNGTKAFVMENGGIIVGSYVGAGNNAPSNGAIISGNVGIGTATPAASAKVDITSTTQGFLPPRMTTTQKNAISSPATGLMVFDTTLAKLCVYTGSAWETITSL